VILALGVPAAAAAAENSRVTPYRMHVHGTGEGIYGEEQGKRNSAMQFRNWRRYGVRYVIALSSYYIPYGIVISSLVHDSRPK
jgi:hypothetical protein